MEEHTQRNDIADARIEIDETLNEPASQTVGVAADAKAGRRAIPIILVTALIASIATAVAIWIFAPATAPTQKQVTRAVIPLSPGAELRGGETSPITISPDGEHVAYVARQGNVRQLYLKAIDELFQQTETKLQSALALGRRTPTARPSFTGEVQ